MGFPDSWPRGSRWWPRRSAVAGLRMAGRRSAPCGASVAGPHRRAAVALVGARHRLGGPGPGRRPRPAAAATTHGHGRRGRRRQGMTSMAADGADAERARRLRRQRIAALTGYLPRRGRPPPPGQHGLPGRADPQPVGACSACPRPSARASSPTFAVVGGQRAGGDEVAAGRGRPAHDALPRHRRSGILDRPGRGPARAAAAAPGESGTVIPQCPRPPTPWPPATSRSRRTCRASAPTT